MRKVVIRFIVSAVAVLVALAASPAVAHPHVWIDGRADFTFDRAGRLTALDIRWTFDELYSVFAVKGLDKNRDGRLDRDELRPMVDDMLTNLKSYGYFTFVQADGEPAAFGPPSGAGATFENNVLTFRFSLPLAEPIDVRRSHVTFTMYDPTFFVAIDIADSRSVRFLGTPPSECSGQMSENQDRIESKSLSETLFQDQTAAGGIAAAYARKLNIACAGTSEKR